MPFKILRVDYFYTMVEDAPGEAYKLLKGLADIGVNLLAFTGVPIGPMRTQLTLFPADTLKIRDAAQKAGFSLDGPHPALFVQGDDELGALAGVHEKLLNAKVNVYASYGVADGQGGYGYILYIKREEYDRALKALEISD